MTLFNMLRAQPYKISRKGAAKTEGESFVSPPFSEAWFTSADGSHQVKRLSLFY